jgi:hypothetical protein
MSLGTDPGAAGEAQRKAEVFLAKAEAARAARLAGRKSAARRLVDRLTRRAGDPGPADSGPADSGPGTRP